MTPTAFHDLPADAFPFRWTFYRVDNDRPVTSVLMEGPGVMEVPALARELGVPVYVHIEFANGEDQWSPMPCCGGLNREHKMDCRWAR